MADVITEFLNNYGGQIVGGALDYLTRSDAAAQGQALLNQFQTMNSDAAQTLIEGYNQQLAAREGLKPTIENNLGEYDTSTVGNLDTFTGDNAALASKYGIDLTEGLDNALGAYNTGAGQYSGTLDTALNTSAPILMAGYQGMENTLSPYMETGQQALNYLAQQMGLDPTQLTPSQKLMLEKYHRDIMGNLNASGLRGSGQAGVAATNRGLAELYAQFYDQNLARAGAAATALNQQGYGATGAVATGRKDLGQALTQLNYSTGEKQAENARRLGDIQGELAYTSGKDIAGTNLNLGQKSTDTTFNTMNNLAKERLNTMSSLETGLANTRADTAGNIAAAKAKALVNSATTEAQKKSLDDYNRGKTFETIADIFSNAKQTPIT